MSLPAIASLPLFGCDSLARQDFVIALLERPVLGQPAELPGFALALIPETEARILVSAPEETAKGVLYEAMTEEDLERLDAFQGVAEGLYERTHAEVRVAGDRMRAYVYVPTSRLLRRVGRGLRRS